MNKRQFCYPVSSPTLLGLKLLEFKGFTQCLLCIFKQGEVEHHWMIRVGINEILDLFELSLHPGGCFSQKKQKCDVLVCLFSFLFVFLSRNTHIY